MEVVLLGIRRDQMTQQSLSGFQSPLVASSGEE